MSPEAKTPISRRDMWLTLALAIARDGMPAPTEQRTQTTRDGKPMLIIETETEAGALRWAGRLGIEVQEWHTSDDGVSVWGHFEGWRTCVRCLTERAPEPEPSPLAAELVAAVAGGEA